MKLDLTAELSGILGFVGEVAIAIRMYSAYSGGSPATYLRIPADQERDSVDLMFLSDALHHFAAFAEVLQTNEADAIVQSCDNLLRVFSGYEEERPELGGRQAKPTFDRWKNRVSLNSAKSALVAIREKAAATAELNG